MNTDTRKTLARARRAELVEDPREGRRQRAATSTDRRREQSRQACRGRSTEEP